MTEWTSNQVCGLNACQCLGVLLVEVCLDCLLAPQTLLEVRLLFALVQFVLVIAADFDDLSAACAVRQHQALQDVVQIQLLAVSKLG